MVCELVDAASKRPNEVADAANSVALQPSVSIETDKSVYIRTTGM